MRKAILSAASLLAWAVCFAQRPATLNRYDLNRPFGWASVAVGGGDFNVTGGGSGSSITIVSSGVDQRAEIQSAVNSFSVVVLDGSAGDFLIGAGGINLSTSGSKNKTIVGINGATLRQLNSTSIFHSYLNARESSMKSHSGGYVSSTHSEIQSVIDADVAEKGQTSKWYVREGDELYVRGYVMDYLFENGMSAEDALAEPVKNWGVFRVNGSAASGTGQNLIIRNISFVGPGSLDLSGQDAFSLSGCNNVWIDHCHFQDGLDGCLDLTHSSDKYSTNITISWCTFSYGPSSWDHRFSSLYNGSASQTLNVTVANCIWGGGIYTRTPLCNNARVHQLNCLFDSPGRGNRVQNSSYDDPSYWVYLDHCYFAAGDNGSGGSRTYIMWSSNGRTCYNKCEGNYFANCEIPSSNVAASVPYSYDPIPAALVPSVLMSASGAGPTLTDPLIIGE